MKTSTTTLLIAGLMATSFNAQAADLSTRVSHSLGKVIAEQGNKAFREMREEIKQNLSQALRPLLPATPAKAGEAALPAYVRMHEEARTRQ